MSSLRFVDEFGAKEFVACQTEDHPGVLILLPFAGAGKTMHEDLKPYEVDQTAEMIHRALNMTSANSA